MAVTLKTVSLEIGARRVRLVLPEGAPETIIYLPGDDEEGRAALAAAWSRRLFVVTMWAIWNTSRNIRVMKKTARTVSSIACPPLARVCTPPRPPCPPN